MTHRLPISFLLLSFLVTAGISKPPLPPEIEADKLPVFEDVTEGAGIDFTHTFGDDTLDNIVKTTGPGVCVFDYNNDGLPDIYLVQGTYLPGLCHPRFRLQQGKLTNKLYRNNGDGTFTDVTEEAGVGDTGFGMAAVAADVNNDGHMDLFVTNYGPNVFYRNNGDGTFTEATAEAGLECDLFGIGATFLDYDRDGYVDLYVGNYLEFDPNYRLYYAPDGFPGPNAYLGQPDALYRNNGDGTFTNVTKEAGVYNPRGRAMGVTSGDYDNDGHMDIFVANDVMVNYLFRNKGDGTFEEVALLAGVGFGQDGEAVSAMGPVFGDIDLDGWLDIIVPDMGYCALYRNLGDGTFAEYSARMGVAEICGRYTSWGGGFIDFNNDGYPDLFIANGNPHRLEEEEDVLFYNLSGRRFVEVSDYLGPYFTEQQHIGRGAAFGDFDNNGWIDIVVMNLDGPAKLLRNVGTKQSNWLNVTVIGTKSNRNGIGTRAILRSGEQIQIRDVTAGSGYLSMNDIRLHFGLGERTRVDTLEIRWPSGIVQVLRDLEVNQFLTVIEPEE